MDPTPLTCSNCQAVTTQSGQTVWVCEACGFENQAVAQPVPADTGAAPTAPPAGVSPTTDMGTTPPPPPDETGGQPPSGTPAA